MSLPLAAPVPWRKITPLHRKLGPRSLTYAYAGGATLPSPASPLVINSKYDASIGIDRVIGFRLSIFNSSSNADVFMTELNSGWQFNYTYPGAKGVTVWDNVITLVDEINLSVSFSADLNNAVALTLFNTEVIPCVID